MLKKINNIKGLKIGAISYGILLVSCILVAAITYVLYRQTQTILEDRLKDRLLSIVSTATPYIKVEEINEIHGAEAVGTNVYQSVVNKLQDIRNYNESITYVYIFRPTEDPNVFEYVADADSIDPNAEVDLDGDGEITEEDALNTPGDEYDVSEIPALKEDALFHPATDEEPVGDQWGMFLSAYSPIKDKGETIAVLGIDVEVTDYLALISKTFFPFLIFVTFLLLLLTILTIALVQIWQKQVNVVTELDKQKDELLSIVSHQLATPISSLKWYTEMMRDGDLGKISKEQKSHLDSMMDVSENLSDLVSMILDVSRIQLGRMRIEKQKLDLKSFYKEILDTIHPKIKDKKINLEVNIPKTFPNAQLDKRYTRMTIENLLSNAVKYTPENGQIKFVVTFNQNKMQCVVTDSGCGIPKKDQEKIFGKLFRASNVRNDFDGNGFGLFVAKGAVEAQGGKIWFESTEGKGTIFNVILPLSN